ncbi:MAG: L,D-transpeptidase family protein [Proteobacteria bacterium]|nr:L,D-transpeptidase family protein [Pseudomonadota bacterium]
MTSSVRIPILSLLTLASLGACSQQPAKAPAPRPVAQAPTLPPATIQSLRAINGADYAAPAETSSAKDAPPDPVLIKAEVLLDRARFSPGVIDGRFGQNVHNAISAWQSAHGLTPDGKLTEAVWQGLTADVRPVLGTYVITEADVSGPFIPEAPKDFEAMSVLKSMAYTSPVELLAERFHMGQDLLRSLNPGVDFTKPGVMIVVANPAPHDLGAGVARVEVDKSHEEVRAYDADDRLVASYPATVGSTDRPSPQGTYKVVGVAQNPTYEYDPKRLTFGKIGHKLQIAAGPNNPVGAVWIALSKPTFGIHGAPEPEKIGKTASHGCVRLTNWDAEELAGAVKPGTVVEFVKGSKRS